LILLYWLSPIIYVKTQISLIPSLSEKIYVFRLLLKYLIPPILCHGEAIAYSDTYVCRISINSEFR
jgi:hypothetical protein